MAYPVKISWADSYVVRPGVHIDSWNDLCSRIIERFGLPGNKYTTELTPDFMIFKFNDAEDALIARLSLGEYAK